MKGRVLVITIFLLLYAGFSFAQITSQQDGDWDDPNTWDCGCVPDVNFFDDIIVNHDVTITNDINLNRVTITNGSIVTINAGITVFIEEDFANTPLIIDAGGTLINNGVLDLMSLLFFTPININGTLESSSTIDLLDPSLLVFNSGSTYRHNHASGGDIPIAIWDSNSTVEISGLTNASPATPNNLNQTFGNFVWNTPAMGATGTFSLGGNLQNVVGNLRFVSTGAPARVVRLASSGLGYNLTIGGDFIIDGGTIFLGATLSTATTINVDGNFLMNGGNVSFALNNANDVTLSVVGNFTKTGGTLTNGTGIGLKNIVFNGSGSNQNYSVNNLTAAFNFIVQSGAVLNLGTSPLTTSGTAGSLTLNGTVRIGSLNGTGAIQGNIPMSTRTFNSGGTIIYAGTGAQFMGSAHPATAGVTTVINNSAGVTLVTNVTIGGNLVLTSGNLSVSNQTLTLNGSFTPNANFLNVTSNSSISIGGAGAFGTLTTTGSTTIDDFTINRVSGGSVILGTNLTITGTLTQTQGDIILNSRTLTISGPYARTFGSFNADTGASFIVDGTGALPAAVTFTGALALNTLTINRAGSIFPTNSSLTLTNLNLLSGTFNNTGTITMVQGGVLTRTEGSIINNTPTTNPTTNSYDIVYDIAIDIVSGAEVPTLTTQLRNVTILGGGELTLTEDITINGNLTITNGSFNASTFAVDLKGNLIANSTSILTASPFTFSGTTTISGVSLVQFGDVTITGSLTPTINIRIDGDLVNDGTLVAGSGGQTVTFGGNTTISGSSTHNFNNLTIAGTLIAPPAMNIAGNFTFTSGTFTSSSGTVVFNGTSSITGTPSFHNITVTGTLNGPANLNLTGDMNLNGTFNAGTGRLTFNGTANQRVDRTSGSAATVNLFNVTVNKANGTFHVASTVASTIFRVQNEFTIAQAGLNNPDVDFDGPSNSGTFVLASTSTRTAKITAVPSGAQIVGNLTVERFIQNTDGARAWRYLAAPIVGATVADWLGEIQITGLFSNPSSGAGIPNPNTPSLFRWSETNGGDVDNRYEEWPNNISLPASSFPLTNGRGYSVFIRNTGTPTITTRGTLNFGNINIGLTSTGSEVDAAGFNLIGNPYPAPIDWDLVTLPGGVSATISMVDNVQNGGLGNGQFVYYMQNGLDVGNFTGVIGSSQAFWVETNTNTTLTFTEANKASAINPIILRQGQLADVLRIRSEGNGRKDETVIYFKDEATNGYDIAYDARKRENEYLNLFSYVAGESAAMDKYAINALTEIECSREILLGLEKFTEGTYTFYFTGQQSFYKPYAFILIDNFLGASVSLDEPYIFQVTADPASHGYERFKVIISEADIDNTLSVTGDERCDAQNVQITINASEENVSYVPYYNGVVIGDTVQGSGGSIMIGLNEDAFTEAGLFDVSIKAFTTCTQVFLDQKAPIEIVEFEEAVIEREASTLTSNHVTGNQWVLNGVEIPGAVSQQYDAQEPGLYTLVVTNPEGCTSSDEYQFLITGLEPDSDRSIRIYPNPVRDKFQVEVEASGPVKATLFDALGTVVTEQSLKGSDHAKSGEFDLSGRSNGIYILRIHKGNSMYQVKIIKSNE